MRKNTSRRYIHLSKVYKRVAERKRNKQRDCLHKASHLIAHRLAGRAVVIGDLSQRQMVIPKKEHEFNQERNKRRITNAIAYNDCGLDGFIQLLESNIWRFGEGFYILTGPG